MSANDNAELKPVDVWFASRAAFRKALGILMNMSTNPSVADVSFKYLMFSMYPEDAARFEDRLRKNSIPYVHVVNGVHTEFGR